MTRNFRQLLKTKWILFRWFKLQISRKGRLGRMTHFDRSFSSFRSHKWVKYLCFYSAYYNLIHLADLKSSLIFFFIIYQIGIFYLNWQKLSVQSMYNFHDFGWTLDINILQLKVFFTCATVYEMFEPIKDDTQQNKPKAAAKAHFPK